jgi:hypothetical protein
MGEVGRYLIKSWWQKLYAQKTSTTRTLIALTGQSMAGALRCVFREIVMEAYCDLRLSISFPILL